MTPFWKFIIVVDIILTAYIVYILSRVFYNI